MNDLEEEIKDKETELGRLKRIQEHNIKIKKKLGRPIKPDIDKFSELICFKVTKTQKNKLDIVKEKGIVLSDYLRQAIFGVEKST